MKENTKKLIKNYVVYLLVLFFFEIVSYFLFKLPFIGMKLIEHDQSFLFGSCTYELNEIIYNLSPLVFCVCFSGIWFKILENNLNNIRQITKIGYWIGIFFYVLFLIVEFIVWFFAQFTTFGFCSAVLENVNNFIQFLPFVYMVLIGIIGVIYTLKRGRK